MSSAEQVLAAIIGSVTNYTATSREDMGKALGTSITCSHCSHTFEAMDGYANTGREFKISCPSCKRTVAQRQV